MLPTLSDDLQRYRWDAKVQANGWNPYAIAPNDPRLAWLRDKYYEVMPGRELPAIYPPATELLFRATWKVFPGPDRLQGAIRRGRCAGAAAARVDISRERRIVIFAWRCTRGIRW